MKDSIRLVDDLKHQLKTRSKDDQIANALDDALNRIIMVYILDQDPHSFASAPKNLPPKIKAYPKGTEPFSAIKKWYASVLEWIPYQPIRYSDLMDRILNNCDCEIWETPHSEIKSALLVLKEDGKIEWDQDWDTWINRI